MLAKYFGKLKSNKLIKNSAIFFVGSMTVSVGNYIYHLIIGRILGPTDYGVLASLISISIILGVPTATIMLVAAKLASNAKVKKNYKQLHYLVKYLLRKLTLAGMVFLAIYCLLSPFLAKFLKIPSVPLVITLGIAMFFAFLLPVTQGTLQGLQKFKALTWNTISTPIVKTGLGVALVLLGFKVYGALGGIVMANIVVFALSFIPLRFLWRYPPQNRLYMRKVLLYSLPVLVSLFSFTLLYNIDVILVKHFFDAQNAGLYSGLSKIGQIIFFGTGAIAAVMFPMVAEKFKKGEPHTSLLRQSLLIVGGLAGIGTLLFFLFPRLVITLLFGSAFMSVAPCVGWFALAMALFSLCNVLMNYFLSIHKFKFIYFMTLITILQIVLISIFHHSITQVVWDINLSIAFLFMGLVFFYFVENKKGSSPQTKL